MKSILIISFLLLTNKALTQYFVGEHIQQAKQDITAWYGNIIFTERQSNNLYYINFKVDSLNTYFELIFENDVCTKTFVTPDGDDDLKTWITILNKLYVSKSNEEWLYYNKGKTLSITLVFEKLTQVYYFNVHEAN